MGITVNPVEKSDLSNQELVNLLMNSPAVHAELEKRRAGLEQASLDARLQAIDAVEAAGAEGARLEREIGKQQKLTDAARLAFDKEAAKLGDLCAQRQAAQRLEGHACEALNAHGEAELLDALSRLETGAQFKDAEARELQTKLAGVRVDIFTGRYPSSHEADGKRLEGLRAEAALFRRLHRELSALCYARISPKALAARVERILAPLRVAE